MPFPARSTSGRRPSASAARRSPRTRPTARSTCAPAAGSARGPARTACSSPRRTTVRVRPSSRTADRASATGSSATPTSWPASACPAGAARQLRPPEPDGPMDGGEGARRPPPRAAGDVLAPHLPLVVAAPRWRHGAAGRPRPVEDGRLLPRLRGERLRARPRPRRGRDPRAQRVHRHRAAPGVLRPAVHQQRPVRHGAQEGRAATCRRWPSSRGPAIGSSAPRPRAPTRSRPSTARCSTSPTPMPPPSPMRPGTSASCWLDLHDRGELDTGFAPIVEPLPYHPPCQLKSHGIGTPAMDLFALVPGLRAVDSDHDCCGAAGTYGLKVERWQIAQDVGAPLFDKVRASRAARRAPPATRRPAAGRSSPRPASPRSTRSPSSPSPTAAPMPPSASPGAESSDRRGGLASGHTLRALESSEPV